MLDRKNKVILMQQTGKALKTAKKRGHFLIIDNHDYEYFNCNQKGKNTTVERLNNDFHNL